MPLPYRVPFQQTCGVFWTLYLSLLNSAYVFFDAHSLLLTLTRGNIEKAKNKTQRTHLFTLDNDLKCGYAPHPITITNTNHKYCPQPSYPLLFVSLAPPSPHVLPTQSQTSSLAVLYDTHLSDTIRTNFFYPEYTLGR
jgi:hypothetical protein